MANPLSLSTKIACNRGKRRMVRDEGGEEVENGREKSSNLLHVSYIDKIESALH
jgi:hypothetical protein